MKKVLATIFLIILGIYVYLVCKNANLTSALNLYGKVIDNIFLIQWILPLIIISVSTYHFYKIINTGFIKNICFRKKYNKFIIKSILKSWIKAVLVFLIPNILIFVICLFYSGFKLYDEAIYVTDAINNHFFLTTFIYYIFYAIFCCNLGLIIMKNKKKYLIVLILSIIVYIAISIFLELGFETILDNFATQYPNISFYTTKFTGLSIFNVFPFYYINIDSKHYISLLFMLLLDIYTSFIVYLIYSDKERIIDEN